MLELIEGLKRDVAARPDLAESGILERLTALGVEAKNLSAWTCASCGARFPQSVRATELEGVTHCTACLERDLLRAQLKETRLRVASAVGGDDIHDACQVLLENLDHVSAFDQVTHDALEHLMLGLLALKGRLEIAVRALGFYAHPGRYRNDEGKAVAPILERLSSRDEGHQWLPFDPAVDRAPGSYNTEDGLTARAALAKIGEADLWLALEARKTLCIWCGLEISYAPGEPGAKERAWKEAVDHDQVCPGNPLVKTVDRLRSALERAEKHLQAFGQHLDQCGPLRAGCPAKADPGQRCWCGLRAAKEEARLELERR